MEQLAVLQCDVACKDTCEALETSKVKEDLILPFKLKFQKTKLTDDCFIDGDDNIFLMIYILVKNRNVTLFSC